MINVEGGSAEFAQSGCCSSEEMFFSKECVAGSEPEKYDVPSSVLWNISGAWKLEHVAAEENGGFFPGSTLRPP